jgi:hypothetical protein
MGRIKDITGQRFGKLLVLGQAPKQEKKQSAWHCICDCGQKCIKRGTALRFGWVKSCGCLSGISDNPNYMKSIVNWIIRMYVGGAKSRSLTFKLNTKQFLNIIQKPCHYCGFKGRDIAALWYQGKIRRMERRATANYDGRACSVSLIANGIDRLDSKKDYTVSNCVPCCAVCNIMKKSMSEEEFLNHIKTIAEYRKLPIN